MPIERDEGQSSTNASQDASRQRIAPLLKRACLLIPHAKAKGFRRVDPEAELPREGSNVLSYQEVQDSFVESAASANRSSRKGQEVQEVFKRDRDNANYGGPNLYCGAPSPSRTFRSHCQ